MKTEKEIKSKIRKLQQYYKDAKGGVERLIILQNIVALKWAIGQKTVHYYFCTNCQEPHKFTKCPRCYNSKKGKLTWGNL